MSHLVSFNGTDTMAAIVLANKAYNSIKGTRAVKELKIVNGELVMYGFSVVATEHSTMTSWGRANERDCVINLLKSFPTGIMSVVGDSYDIFTFTKMLSEDAEIKELILSRDGKFVLRPDSGEPVEICSTLIKLLWDGFGGEINSKGYKVLNPKVGLIQGDGIDLVMMESILMAFVDLKFAASNIVFGSGGGLIQKFDRDTLKFAIKCTFAVICGEEVDVQKDPITAKGKKSKKGRVGLFIDEHGHIVTEQELDSIREQEGLLELVFDFGELVRFQTFEEVRENARVGTPEYLLN